MEATKRKRWTFVMGWMAALAFLFSCGGREEGFVLPESGAHLALADIDSLMWRQPDSAFANLMDFASNHDTDSLEEFDRHYFNMLLSELLYKNKAQIIKDQYSHEIQQKALSGKLKKSNEVLRDTLNQLKTTSDKEHPKPPRKEQDFGSFLEEPICRMILDTVQREQFKSKIDYTLFKKHALNNKQLLALRAAADDKMDCFTVRLKKQFHRLTDEDVTYCCLYLLGLSEADVSALMQKAYATVCERKRKIRKILGEEGDLVALLR